MKKPSPSSSAHKQVGVTPPHASSKFKPTPHTGIEPKRGGPPTAPASKPPRQAEQATTPDVDTSNGGF